MSESFEDKVIPKGFTLGKATLTSDSASDGITSLVLKYFPPTHTSEKITYTGLFVTGILTFDIKLEGDGSADLYIEHQGNFKALSGDSDTIIKTAKGWRTINVKLEQGINTLNWLHHTFHTFHAENDGKNALWLDNFRFVAEEQLRDK
jgi:hypothetical protein